MANQIFSRIIPKTLTLTSSISRSLSTTTVPSSATSFLYRLRPLSAASLTRRILIPNSHRALSTRATTSSLNDPNPNWSNRPPKETILLDGCDFEHWLIVMEKPEPDPVTGEPTRDEIIASYIRTLAQVVGSEQEARMKIYSVSTRNYFAFGALVSEELSIKIKELPNVRWVLPDSYLNVREKDYGGEPFINGEAVPYDPKYHEEWVRNNARANERNRRNDRPRNADRPRNFDRRRENVVNRDMNTRPPSPPHAQISGGGFPPNTAGSGGGYPPNNAGSGGGYPPNNAGSGGGFPPNNAGSGGGYPPNNVGSGGGYPPNNAGSGGGYPPNNAGSGGGYPPNNAGSGGGFPPNNARGYPPNNSGGYGTPNSGGFAPQNSGGYAPQNSGGYALNNNRSPPPNSGYNPAGPPNAGWSNHQ